MRKIIHMGFALLMGTVFVSCSNDEDSLPNLSATWKDWPIISAEGGRNTLVWDAAVTWEYLYKATAYYGSYPTVDTKGVGVDLPIEHIDDTLKCGWLKIWRPKTLFSNNMMVVEAEPNTTSENRHIKLTISVSYGTTKDAGYYTRISQYGCKVEE